MRRGHRLAVLVLLAAALPVLAGCEDFDPDQLDFLHLNEKKKLPGERKELFPGGVPGVTQGVPPEYMKGYKAPDDTANADAALPPASKVNPGDEDASAALKPETASAVPAEKPKPKPKQKTKPKPQTAQRAPTQITIQPATAAQQPVAASQSPWPAPQQPQTGQSPWPDSSPPTSNNSPWPAPPPPGTFSR